MKYFYFKVFLILSLMSSSFLAAQNNTCEFAEPACPGDEFGHDIPTVSGGGDAENGPYYDCLYSQPNPLWYYIKIDEAGDIIFDLQQWSGPNQTGADYDVDFIVWGPFTEPTCGTALSASMVVDCSYSASSFETITIPDAQEGEYYMLLVTNWEDEPGYITLTQDGGDGTFDCSIVTEGDSYGFCDLDYDGQESFDLNQIAAEIIDEGEPDWVVTFYDDESNAENETGPTLASPYIVYEANNPTNIFARIEEDGFPVEIRKLYLYVHPEPLLNVFEIDLTLCDSDGDGEEIFDLTQTQPDFVTDTGSWDFTYYTDINDAHNASSNDIDNPDAYPSETDVIYVRIDAGANVVGVDEGCYAIGVINLILADEILPEFEIENEYCVDMTAPPLPDISDNGINGTWNPAVIDTSIEGETTYTFTPEDGQCAIEFELVVEVTEGVAPEFTIETQYCLNSTAPGLPTVSDNGVAGTWSPSTIDTSTPGTTIYTFTPNETSCMSNLEISIEILEALQLNPVAPIELCDDDFDGNYTYDLTDLEYEVSPGTGYTLQYYSSQTNAENNSPIPTADWTNYEFTGGMPGSIWVVAQNADECRSTPLEVQFVEKQGINLSPEPYEIPFCNGEPIDLTEFEDIYTSETGVTYSYHTTMANAQNDLSPITNFTNYTPASVGSLLHVRLEKSGRCAEVVTVEFIAGEEVAHNSGPFDPITYCVDDAIDLTQYEGDITSDTTVDFSYYMTENEAVTGTGSEITNTGEFDPNGSSGSVFIRLESSDACPAVVEITFEPRSMPTVQVSNQETLCEGEEIEITATSDNEDDVIQWTDEDGNTFEGETQTFTETGTYTVIAIGGNNCQSEPQIVTISPPSPPTITNIESGNGYLVVYAANGGAGPMEYSLDGILWQSSNQFNNLVNGETYTVYVRSDGCVKTSYTITILDVPNFVSPNGDGYNDSWTIRGIEVTPDATIKIFDRYGKIFVDTNFDGDYIWDGKYNGGPLPSGDYWYILNVPGDGVIVPQKYSGHVSIRN